MTGPDHIINRNETDLANKFLQIKNNVNVCRHVKEKR